MHLPAACAACLTRAGLHMQEAQCQSPGKGCSSTRLTHRACYTAAASCVDAMPQGPLAWTPKGGRNNQGANPAPLKPGISVGFKPDMRAAHPRAWRQQLLAERPVSGSNSKWGGWQQAKTPPENTTQYMQRLCGAAALHAAVLHGYRPPTQQYYERTVPCCMERPLQGQVGGVPKGTRPITQLNKATLIQGTTTKSAKQLWEPKMEHSHKHISATCGWVI